MIQRRRLTFLIALPMLLLPGTMQKAAADSASEYTFRVHIFQRHETTMTRRGALEGTRGTGSADLFENGEPRGLDFSYECMDNLQPSHGYETYKAKWKKKDAVLTILVPEKGKPSASWKCDLKVDMKNFVYGSHDGKLRTETADRYKAWMTRRQYDPEHGKEIPIPDPDRKSEKKDDDDTGPTQ